MPMLIAGLAAFFLAHLVPTAPKLKEALAARWGLPAYRSVFAMLSFGGLALIVLGYGQLQVAGTANPQLWEPPRWTRHVAFTLMLPALILLVAAYVPSRIRTAVRHPMLVAIKLWAVAHLIANGDLASLLLFGSFLGFAVYDRISVKKRDAPGPLGAKVGTAVNDVVVIVAGLALYLFMLLWGHAWLIGVPLVNM